MAVFIHQITAMNRGLMGRRLGVICVTREGHTARHPPPPLPGHLPPPAGRLPESLCPQLCQRRLWDYEFQERGPGHPRKKKEGRASRKRAQSIRNACETESILEAVLRFISKSQRKAYLFLFFCLSHYEPKGRNDGG